MPGEIVNLRRARKAQQRRTDEETAAENRARFGRIKSEKTVADLKSEKERRQLDGHRLTPIEKDRTPDE